MVRAALLATDSSTPSRRPPRGPVLVGVGDRVGPGTPLATVGRSGLNAARQRSPTHLHLTVLKVADGRPAPANILPQLRKAYPLPVN